MADCQSSGDDFLLVENHCPISPLQPPVPGSVVRSWNCSARCWGRTSRSRAVEHLIDGRGAASIESAVGNRTDRETRIGRRCRPDGVKGVKEGRHGSFGIVFFLAVELQTVRDGFEEGARCFEFSVETLIEDEAVKRSV